MIPNEPARDVTAVLNRHRALAILRLLARDEMKGAGNEAVLSALLDGFALGGSRATIRASLQRLEQAGLLTVTPNQDLLVARLTREGAEVAEGRTRADGVEPVSVECPY